MKRSAVLAILLLCAIVAVTFPFAGPAAAQDLRILHMNDFHGFAESHKTTGSDDMRGGIAALAWVCEKLKDERPSILLGAGDMIQGHPWANLFEGRPVIEVMNAMGFDAMVVGNHEFDFGVEVLAERVSEASFPILGANVTGLGILNPYTIIEVAGLKVAVIGVVTEDTPTVTHPKNVENLTFLPVAETVARYVGELKDRADIIVVLSHLGLNADMDLANTVAGIDVIVGGHSHTKTGKHITVNGTIIVQAWEHALALGVLDLTVKDGRIVDAAGRLEEIWPSKMGQRKDVADIVNAYNQRIKGIMNEVVGTAAVDLDGENIRTGETNLGNFVADVIREEAGADATIINAGSIRTGIKKGAITVGSIYSALPFNNYIVAIRLTGKQISEAIEYGLSGIESKEGRFPQVSGIAFAYSPQMPPGKRVRSISIGGEPIDQAKEYIVATNDFLAAGGDGYQVFREAIRQPNNFSITGGTIVSTNLTYNDSSRSLQDIIVQTVRKMMVLDPPLEGRIRKEDCDEGLCK